MTMRVVGPALALALACSRNDPAPPSEPPAPVTPPAPATPPTPVTPAAPATPPAAAPPPTPATPTPTTEAAGAKPPARDFDDVKGLTTAELVAHWGEPDAKTGERWTYKFPRTGCTDEQRVYVLHLRAGKVVKIDRTTQQTGKVCAPIE